MDGTPPTQLELRMDARLPAGRRVRARATGLARAALHWTPVWVPLVFLGQIVALGLLPARAEHARLDRAEREVRARADALEREEAELERESRMLSDEIYRERVRRSRTDGSPEPLTLERARTGPER